MAGGSEYSRLSEKSKKVVRACVKGEIPLSKLSPRLATFAREFMAKNKSRGRGTHKAKSRSSGHRATRSYGSRSGLRMAGAVAIPQELAMKIRTPSAAWLQAVGSPFTDIKDIPGQIMPRRPDPYYTASSVGIRHESRLQFYVGGSTGPAGGVADSYIFKLAFPFALGGIDVRGDRIPIGVQMPADIVIGNFVAWVKANMVPLVTSGQQNYPTFYSQLADMEKWRVTAVGLKAHDVGQVLTRQGEFFGHEVNYYKFMKSMREQLAPYFASLTNPVARLYAAFGIGGFMDYAAPSATFTTTKAEIQGLLETARQAAVENQNIGHELSPDMGMTQRYRDPKDNVSFSDLDPRVFHYDPGNIIQEMQEFDIDSVMSMWPNDVAPWIKNHFEQIPDKVFAVRQGAYCFKVLKYQNTGLSWLCTWARCLPMGYVDEAIADLLGTQGNSLLCLQATQMARDGSGAGRQLNVYTSTFLEITVAGLSVMAQSDAPTDLSYSQLMQIANNFPVTVKGFSFFSSLWHGVKKAVHWVGQNEGSIIKGVQAGARIARTVGSMVG